MDADEAAWFGDKKPHHSFYLGFIYVTPKARGQLQGSSLVAAAVKQIRIDLDHLKKLMDARDNKLPMEAGITR